MVDADNEVEEGAEEMRMRPLDGDAPPDFDCGAGEQNDFFHLRAWNDQQRGISVTHVLYLNGVAAAFLTLMADRIRLGQRERPQGVTYQFVPALKVAQLGVATAFQGRGLGRLLIGYAVETATRTRERIGCRYVTLDARGERLAAWYESQGFKRNREEQRTREEEARMRGRDTSLLAISMRFDLRDA